jgi:hypothetical protein
MMEDSQKAAFLERLTEIMLAYGKPLHDRAVLDAWWRQLQEFPLRIVALAFSAYREENDTFAPVPNSIYKRCLLMDGRPGAEEAWAIALRSTDEASTVVWTQEIAAAFAICRPVLDSSGAISARKPFLEAYVRLVTEARAIRRPAEWVASLGWDPAEQARAIRAATAAGQLAGSAAALLLEGPAGDPTPDAPARAQLDKVRQMLKAMEDERELRALVEIERQDQADRIYQLRTQQIVDQYQQRAA